MNNIFRVSGSSTYSNYEGTDLILIKGNNYPFEQKVTNNTASSHIKYGEEKKIANFKIELENIKI